MYSSKCSLLFLAKSREIDECLLKNFYIQPLLALNPFASYGRSLTSAIARFLIIACVIRVLLRHIFSIQAISFFYMSGNSGFLPFTLYLLWAPYSLNFPPFFDEFLLLLFDNLDWWFLINNSIPLYFPFSCTGISFGSKDRSQIHLDFLRIIKTV
jgi:hypothetical protein